jgi:hypothetical protein
VISPAELEPAVSGWSKTPSAFRAFRTARTSETQDRHPTHSTFSPIAAILNPDGYTPLLVGVPNAINVTLYDKLNFNFIRDVAPVAGIHRELNVMKVTV